MIPIMPLKKDIGARFKKMREFLKLSQRELAKKLKILPSSLSQIENGKIYPTIELIYLLIERYRLNASWLIKGDGDIFLTALDTLSEIRGEGRLDDEKYIKLLREMRDPIIEHLMFSRLIEIEMYLGRPIAIDPGEINKDAI